jgi:arylsulfatase A-like enzyme
LAERGVRFIQLFNPGWDHHGQLPKDFPREARDSDQACAGLIQDLKQRGMLKDTLVIWGSEFGRTPYSQGRIGKRDVTYGRDHHPNAMCFWMAGAGVRPGISYGQTDELGFNAIENRVGIHDVHATMLHLLGIDHERFTYRYQGRDFRLTDVSGNVLKDILV